MARTNRKRLRALAAAALVLILLLASLILYAHYLIHRPSIQKLLVDHLSSSSGYSIETGPIELNLRGGIGVYASDVRAVSPNGMRSIRAEAVRIVLDPADLLRGRVAPVSLTLVRPRIQLEAGTFEAFLELEDPLPLPWISGLESLSVEQGTVVFGDRPYSLERFGLEVSPGGEEVPRLTISSKGRLIHKGREAPFKVRGALNLPAEGEPFGPFDLFIESGPVPAGWIPWPRNLHFEEGDLGAAFSLRGNPGEPVEARGRLSLSGAEFTLVRQERKKLYAPPDTMLVFEAQCSRSRLSAQDMTLRTPDLSLAVGLDVKKAPGGEPLIRLDVESRPMDLSLFKLYFPTPLISSWVERRLFPLLAAGQTRLERLSLHGTIPELKELDEPENAHAFSMAVRCTDFRVEGSGLPKPFEEVSGLVAYKAGDLMITELKAGFDGSTLKEGRLEARGILEERIKWDALVDGEFRLGSLMKQRGIRFIPPDTLKKLKRMGSIQGFLSCRAWFRYEKGWDFPRLGRGLFVIKDCTVRQPELRLPLFLDSAEIRLSDRGKNVFEAEGSWGGSDFEAEGSLGREMRFFPLEKAELSARMDMNEVLPFLSEDIGLPLAFEDQVFTRLSLEKKADTWSCRGSVALEGATIGNQWFSIRPAGSGDRVDFDLIVSPEGRIDIREMRCRIRGSTLEGSGEYHHGGKGFFRFQIASLGVDLEELGLDFPGRGRVDTGVLKGELEIIQRGQEPFSALIHGRLKGDGVCGRLEALRSEIKDASFDAVLSGKDISINSCRMKVGKSTFKVEGGFEGWKGLRGELRIQTDYFIPEEFVSPEDLELEKTAFPEDLQLEMDFACQEARVRDLQFGPLRAELSLADGQIMLKRARIRLEHGVITSSGIIRGGSNPAVSLANHV
ncbi:MAG: hypothetical protein ACLFUP_07640, partial [Desulfobacteraceae bacterium]